MHFSDARYFIKGLQKCKHEHTSVQSLIKNTFMHTFQLWRSQCQNLSSSRFLNLMSHNLCDESKRFPWRPTGNPLRLKIDGWQLPDIVPRLSITASLCHSSGLSVSINIPLAITGTAAVMATTKNSPVRIYPQNLSLVHQQSEGETERSGGQIHDWIKPIYKAIQCWIRLCGCVYA